jgi:hypothetical protein
MKQVIVSVLMAATLLVWFYRKPYKASFEHSDCKCKIKELEIRKAEELYLFHTKRFEQLRSIYPLHNKDVMEAEIKMKLSGLDLEIERLMPSE